MSISTEVKKTKRKYIIILAGLISGCYYCFTVHVMNYNEHYF